MLWRTVLTPPLFSFYNKKDKRLQISHVITQRTSTTLIFYLLLAHAGKHFISVLMSIYKLNHAYKGCDELTPAILKTVRRTLSARFRLCKFLIPSQDPHREVLFRFYDHRLKPSDGNSVEVDFWSFAHAQWRTRWAVGLSGLSKGSFNDLFESSSIETDSKDKRVQFILIKFFQAIFNRFKKNTFIDIKSASSRNERKYLIIAEVQSKNALFQNKKRVCKIFQKKAELLVKFAKIAVGLWSLTRLQSWFST